MRDKLPSAERHVNDFSINVREFWLMRITYPSLLLLALSVASCGGGGGGGGGGSPSSPDQNSGKTPTESVSTGGLIEYYGDSTIWGCQSGSSDCSAQVATTAPEAFAQQLPAKYSVDLSHNGGSQGVSGSTACQLLEGRDGAHPVWDTQMKDSKAKYVIMNFGINDATHPVNRYDVSRYTSCLRELARIAKSYNKQVVFETPNPINESGLKPYVEAMQNVASEQQLRVIDQYKYLTDYMASQQKGITDDGLHPTQEVYILKGKYAAGEFLKFFP